MTTTPRRIAGGIARAFGFLVLLFLLHAALTGLLAMPVAWLVAQGGDRLQLNSVLNVLAALLATAIMLRAIDSRSWRDVGLARSAASPRAIVEGWCLAGATIGLACVLLLAPGWLRLEPSAPGSSLAAAVRISMLLLPA